MARIRTIKPEFFTSEDIVSLSPLARLLYVALWCESDKEGRLNWKPKTFKMRYLPADDCNIESLCSELIDSGLVVRYGVEYAYIPMFTRHQHVNPRESASTLPEPEGVKNQGPKKVGKTLREAVFERDGYMCVRCKSDDHLQIDHILPQSCGGPHIIENLRTLCRSCNASRPVNGKALDDDLMIDGYTRESLREKLGIDASILDVNAQVGREGKGKERKGKEGVASDDASVSTRSPKGSRLAADWVLPKQWGEWAMTEQPTWTADHCRQIGLKFGNYWQTKTGKDATKLDWFKTWQNWVITEGPMKGSNKATTQGAPIVSPAIAQTAQLLDEQKLTPEQIEANRVKAAEIRKQMGVLFRGAQ